IYNFACDGWLLRFWGKTKKGGFSEFFYDRGSEQILTLDSFDC
ncbi:MAG: hypothetical protein ACI90V_005500, partial [Bacillariaceae sp.]